MNNPWITIIKRIHFATHIEQYLHPTVGYVSCNLSLTVIMRDCTAWYELYIYVGELAAYARRNKGFKSHLSVLFFSPLAYSRYTLCSFMKGIHATRSASRCDDKCWKNSFPLIRTTFLCRSIPSLTERDNCVRIWEYGWRIFRWGQNAFKTCLWVFFTSLDKILFQLLIMSQTFILFIHPTTVLYLWLASGRTT